MVMSHGMTTQIDTTNELRKLGLRIPLAVVREAAQRLRNGESLYALYKMPDSGPPFIAKGTASKIKRLLDQGRLEILFGSQPEPQIEGSAFGASAIEDANDINEANQVRLAAESNPFLSRIVELRPRLPQVDWDIENLESVGIPTLEGLALLIQHDALMSQDIGTWTRPVFQRYVELHYRVEFCREGSVRRNTAPLDLIKLAASSYANGLIDDNLFLKKAGRDILRFQVWRGQRFLRAYEIAQVPTHRAAEQLKIQFMADLTSILEAQPKPDGEGAEGRTHSQV